MQTKKDDCSRLVESRIADKSSLFEYVNGFLIMIEHLLSVFKNKNQLW